MNESELMKKLLLESGDAGCVLFRNNTGMGWAGQLIERDAAGTVTLRNARPLHAGLCVGSSDTIGWAMSVVTPEMVGHRIAIFLAVECKARGGRLSLDQSRFLSNVNKSGGIGMIHREGEKFELK
ncbi:MAG: VRR-NUC domain-containing protein [Alphaproteobacteria bacterium]